MSVNSTPSFTWKEQRNKLLKEYAKEKNEKLVLETNKTFSSPSTAASFCMGRSANGWSSWKDKDGQTLDEAYRKQLEN